MPASSTRKIGLHRALRREKRDANGGDLSARAGIRRCRVARQREQDAAQDRHRAPLRASVIARLGAGRPCRRRRRHTARPDQGQDHQSDADLRPCEDYCLLASLARRLPRFVRFGNGETSASSSRPSARRSSSTT